MNDEPITSRELIAAYRSQVRPSAAARERMLQAIAAPRREAPPPPAPPRAAPVWLALAAALALIGVSAYLLAGARHDAHVAPAEMMMAPQVTPPSQDAVTTTRESPHPAGDPTPDPPPPTEPPAIAEQPAPGESTHPADPPADETTRPGEQPPPGESTHSADPPSPRPRPRAEPTGDQVLAELALIQRIKEALDADQPARALTLVEQHARSFARGTLIEEREALRVVALCADDDPKRGLRAQRSFLRAYPRSAYGDRVRGACPAEPSPHFP